MRRGVNRLNRPSIDGLGRSVCAAQNVGGAPSHAIAICDTPGGERTVVRSEDAALLDAMTREELVGRTVQVAADGGFITR